MRYRGERTKARIASEKRITVVIGYRQKPGRGRLTGPTEKSQRLLFAPRTKSVSVCDCDCDEGRRRKIGQIPVQCRRTRLLFYCVLDVCAAEQPRESHASSLSLFFSRILGCTVSGMVSKVPLAVMDDCCEVLWLAICEIWRKVQSNQLDLFLSGPQLVVQWSVLSNLRCSAESRWKSVSRPGLESSMKMWWRGEAIK